MNPAVLAEKVRATAVEVLADRGLDSTVLPETVRLERPRNPSHGDYATSIALQVSRQIGVSSRDLACWLAEALAAGAEIEDAQVAGPGFLNLRIATAALGDVVVDVETAAARYGHGTRLAGRKIEIEFSRAGLIDADTARLVATGDALARVLAAQGAEVGREYVVADDEKVVDSLMDVTRYALVRTPLDSPVGIDLDLLDARVRANPVFLVRYAHARISRVVENSTKFGMDPAGADLGLLTHESEGAAIRTLGEFPEVVATAAELREPHRVCRYLEELAGALHRWHDTPGCTILPKGDDDVAPVYLARLRLARAVRQVLANGLEMLGVSAPERM